MYQDSCILLKLLVVEPDSEFFQEALAGHLLSTSELARTEVWSALLAKERNKLINGRQRAAAWGVFNEQVQTRQLRLFPLQDVVLKKANSILEYCHPKVPLR